MRWAYLHWLHDPSGMDFFFVFRDLQANIVFIRDNKRGKNFKPPHLHQKRLHYSWFLYDYILQLEDVIKRAFHSQLLSLLIRGCQIQPKPTHFSGLFSYTSGIFGLPDSCFSRLMLYVLLMLFVDMKFLGNFC